MPESRDSTTWQFETWAQDVEVQVIEVIWQALAYLSDDERDRVLRYVTERNTETRRD